MAESKLTTVRRKLLKLHGNEYEPTLEDPFQLILWEQVAYLATDARRAQAFSLLEEDPDLASYPLLSDALRQRWEGTLAFATVG